MEIKELIELKKALEIVKNYEEELGMRVFNKKQYERLVEQVNNSLREKSKVDVEHRLAEIEIKLSQLLNKK